MAWRIASSLDILRQQVNAIAPSRSKISDGTIGDASHAAVASDHNPDGNGVVKAMDLTHDPGKGADMQKIADSIIASNDSRIWYIIFNRRIWEKGVGWKAYYGSNPHDKHAHFNTVHTPSLYDNTNHWKIGGGDTDMIGAQSTNTLRIGHTEIGGWNFDEVHNQKKHDALFHAAWNGKPVEQFIYSQWLAGGGYRAARLSQAKAIQDLNNALNGTKAELKAAQDALLAANAKVEAESKKATEAGIKTAALEADKTADTATGNSFLRWIGNILRGGN